MASTTRRRLREPRTRTVLAVLALLALTAGCGLGPQPEPVALSRAPARPTAQQTGSPTIRVVTRVYLVHNGVLVQVRRSAPLRDTHLETVLGALLRPLRFAERNQGLRTALPTTEEPVKVRIRGHLATLRLPPGFDSLAVSEQILAVGQLVFTISQDSRATRIQFTDGKHHIAVPDGGGRLVDRPVTRSDYARIAP